MLGFGNRLLWRLAHPQTPSSPQLRPIRTPQLDAAA
jgi:hypothetical protein